MLWLRWLLSHSGKWQPCVLTDLHYDTLVGFGWGINAGFNSQFRGQREVSYEKENPFRPRIPRFPTSNITVKVDVCFPVDLRPYVGYFVIKSYRYVPQKNEKRCPCDHVVNVGKEWCWLRSEKLTRYCVQIMRLRRQRWHSRGDS